MFNTLLAVWVRGTVWTNHGKGLPVDENRVFMDFNNSGPPPFCKEKSQ